MDTLVAGTLKPVKRIATATLYKVEPDGDDPQIHIVVDVDVHESHPNAPKRALVSRLEDIEPNAVVSALKHPPCTVTYYGPSDSGCDSCVQHAHK